MTEKDRQTARARGDRLDAYDETILLAAPDKPFRRSLFIVLIAVGLFAGGSFFYARTASEDAAAAKQRATIAQQQRDDLSKQLDALIALEMRRDAQARAERQRLIKQQQESAKLFAGFLSSSQDPVLKAAARAYIRDHGSPSPSTTPRPRASDSPSASPEPHRPSPSPTRSPTPRPSPSQICVPGPLRICI